MMGYGKVKWLWMVGEVEIMFLGGSMLFWVLLSRKILRSGGKCECRICCSGKRNIV